MIIKGRDSPISLIGYEVLLKRLSKSHEKYYMIQDRFLSAKAGRGGEEEFDRIIEKQHLGVPHLFLHDLSLNKDFQVDSLLITQNYLFVFEIKNLGGKINFLSNPLRVEQEYEDGKERAYDLSQMDKSTYYLSRWLEMRGIKLPVYRAFVLPYPKKFENHTNMTVLFPNAVPPYIRSIRQGKTRISESQMKEIGEQLKLEHRGFKPFPMCKRWGIDPKDLLTGVECEKCGRLGMEKVIRGWFCRKCGFFNVNAHEKTMKEYFMLVGDTITNRECRWFLGIGDRHVATRILIGMKLAAIGEKRHTKYVFDYQNMVK
ncbi:nuclease-related domain-containing protein [Chungangia koreensis]|uniref:Nuclease-related domain-containing protein n=1 Tax=Chungangia koreensis TaxID=752657 RepID=A0ABV8X2S2_9LACT